MERPLALVVDRDSGVRGRARALLAEAGIEALEAGSGAEALELLRTRSVRIAILDPDTPGVVVEDFLRRALRARPSLVPLILAANAATPEALRLLDDGAYDLLDPALDPAAVRVVAARALSRNKLLEDLAGLREQLRSRTGYGKMVGRSAAMEQVRERLERQAASNAPVHFEGEDGVGRELAARTVHDMSARSGAPFSTLDCASLRGSALESEIFGHDGGGTDGGRRACGLIEGAAGGAIFLRSVDTLPDAMQKRLAEALREGRVRGSGAGRAIPIDVRVYSSSVRPIDAAALGRGVREELRSAMVAAVVPVPALRERREDIALLARHFLDAIREINELPELTLSPDALRVLEGHAWPGNVRELRNAVEHAAIVATEHTIRPGDLPSGVQEEPGGTSASRRFREAKREVVDSFERAYLSDLLAQHRGNVTAAAHQAGMLRSALQRLLRKHDLRSMDFRGGSRPRGSESPS